MAPNSLLLSKNWPIVKLQNRRTAYSANTYKRSIIKAEIVNSSQWTQLLDQGSAGYGYSLSNYFFTGSWCIVFFSWFQIPGHIKEERWLSESLVIRDETKARIDFENKECFRAVQAWKAHLLRSVNQEEAKKTLLLSFTKNQAWFIMDWAMKYLLQQCLKSCIWVTYVMRQKQVKKH